MRPFRQRIIFYSVAVIVTACVSVACTLLIMNRRQGERVVLSGDEYQNYLALEPIIELQGIIGGQFYGDVPDSQALISGALSGMLSSTGDIYARYYTDEQYTAYLNELKGAYHGIGVLVSNVSGSGAQVLKVYASGPADEAGVQPGDIIYTVDGVALIGKTLEEIETIFDGADGTEITIDILRDEEELHFTMVRTSGQAAYVTHRLFNQRTGYIQIDKFSGSAADEFAEALHDLTDRGMRSLVIDLRNNPGGELEQVVSIANQLMDEGVIVSVKSSSGEEKTYKSDTKHTAVPLAVLINEHSASASEILAAAIKDSGRGIVVGTPSYGKGVVQTTMRLAGDHGWVKLTTAAYFTPAGYNVDSTGVVPDIDVDLSDEMKKLPIDMLIAQDEDAQLWAALDIIRAEADEIDAAVSGSGTVIEGDDEADEGAA